MSSSRLVRGAKTRMFAIVCLICVLGAVVFVFHGTQSKLVEVQKLVNSCNQQQESLSAQLQVIFEYKVRLEKSLTKEKEDHKLTKETLEGKLGEEKKMREKENQESKNKYDALVQQNKFLQSQLDDLKESEKTQVSKLSEETGQLKKELETLKKESKEILLKKDGDLEHLKSEYLKQQDDINKLTRDNEELKANLLSKNSHNQVDHLDKVNFQLKEEIEKLKRDLSDCEDAKPKSKQEPEPQPDTNVGVMPKMVYNGQKINGSTTPGLNPDAVNNFEVSSTKPIKESEIAIMKKPDDQVAQPLKKPTQESVRPLPLPGQLEAGPEFGQIPLPGGHDPLANTLHKPNTRENQDAQLGGPPMIGGGQGEPDALQPRLFVAAPPENKAEEEDNFIKQGEIPRIKNAENYHGADYEREQPEDEEDDEGEQLDYEAERNKKEQKNVLPQPVKIMPPSNHEGGVMVNPK